MTWRKLSARWVAVAGLVASAIDCGKPTPTGPTPGQALASAPLYSLQIVGSDSVPPGASTQFKLTAYHSDRTQRDVTGEATWRSSSPEVLRIGDRGEATGVQEGESGITAQFGGLTAQKLVYVLEPGTWKVAGTISESGFSLPGVRVEVVAGGGAGKTATTDGRGNYALFGVAGAVQLRASADGYVSDTRTITVSSHQQRVDFSLQPLAAPRDVSGDWRLTFDASPDCGSLPDFARQRTYTAGVEQNVSTLIVRLRDATFGTNPVYNNLMDRFRGRIAGDRLTLTFGTYEYYGLHYDLGEVLPDKSLFTITGTATGTATAAAMSGALDGTIAVTQGKSVSSCGRHDHRFTLVRSSITARR